MQKKKSIKVYLPSFDIKEEEKEEIDVNLFYFKFMIDDKLNQAPYRFLKKHFSFKYNKSLNQRKDVYFLLPYLNSDEERFMVSLLSYNLKKGNVIIHNDDLNEFGGIDFLKSFCHKRNRIIISDHIETNLHFSPNYFFPYKKNQTEIEKGFFCQLLNFLAGFFKVNQQIKLSPRLVAENIVYRNQITSLLDLMNPIKWKFTNDFVHLIKKQHKKGFWQCAIRKIYCDLNKDNINNNDIINLKAYKYFF